MEKTLYLSSMIHINNTEIFKKLELISLTKDTSERSPFNDRNPNKDLICTEFHRSVVDSLGARGDVVAEKKAVPCKP